MSSTIACVPAKQSEDARTQQDLVRSQLVRPGESTDNRTCHAEVKDAPEQEESAKISLMFIFRYSRGR